MNYVELCKKVSKQVNVVYPDVRLVIDTFLEEVKNALLKGDRVYFKDFGRFKSTLIPPRKHVNPKTREQVISKPKYRINFKVFSDFKGKLQQAGIEAYEKNKNKK